MATCSEPSVLRFVWIQNYRNHFLAQIEATTNHEAMRDLSGRRQRDVNNEKKLVKYVEGAAERERLEREKREAKMEKLRMMAEGEVYNRDKHSFSDADYDKVFFLHQILLPNFVTNAVMLKARSEVEEKIHDAMEAAMAAGEQRQECINLKIQKPIV